MIPLLSPCIELCTCVRDTPESHSQAVIRLSMMNLVQMTYITCMNSLEHEVTVPFERCVRMRKAYT